MISLDQPNPKTTLLKLLCATAIGMMVCLAPLAASPGLADPAAPAGKQSTVAGTPDKSTGDEQPSPAKREDSPPVGQPPDALSPSTTGPPGKDPPTASANTKPESAVIDIGPDIYYLPDENGKLRPVPGWTLEDFRRLIDQQSAEDQALAFSLQRLTAQGKVEGNHVRLNVEIAVKVAPQRNDRWVRVPLQMSGAILTEAAGVNRGTLILEYLPKEEGYIAWLKDVGEEPAVLTLPMLLPIKNLGGQHQIAWNLPPVAPSQLKLLVPQPGVEAEVSSPATLLPPVTAAGGSEITALGLGGELRLRWHPPDGRNSSRGRLVEAEGAHFVRIERGLIRTQAQFAIRSLGGDLDRVHIRLPRGSRLLPDDSVRGYTTRQIDANPKKPAAGDRPLIEIQPDKTARGPLNIQLACEQSYDVSGPKSFTDLATFEVEGAARHWGSIAVQVVGDWHLFWQDTVNVRRVDSVPTALPAGDLTAAFEYSGQPYRLAARVAPPVTRVSVEPQYVMEVSADGPAGGTSLKLDARLKCRVSGAKIFELPLDLAGWEIQDGNIGPPSRIDVSRLPPAGPGPLKIPLAAPLKGEFEIAFSARRRLPAGPLATTFPRPLADNVVAATVVVLPDDNVQLTPKRDAMTALAPLPILPAISLPPRAQPPFFYRAEKPEARLVAEVQVHSRTVSAESVSAIRILEQTVQVRQSIQFDVSHEAVEWLSILVPRELAEPGTVQVSLAGTAIQPLEVPKAVPAAAAGVEWRLPLPKPRIGNIVVSLDYQIPIDRSQSSEASEQVLPLVVPTEAKMRRNELILDPASSTKVQIADPAWSRAEENTGHAAGHRYRAKETPRQVTLLVSRRAQPTSGVTVQRGWVQSWFSGKVRYDRAAYLLRSREDCLQIELPAGAEQATSEAWLDGKPVPIEFSTQGALTIPLPASNRTHRLLLRYRFPMQGGGWLLHSTLPRFSAGTWVQKLYWQLVLPPDALLIGAPEGTTPEYLWQRQGWTWQRQSSLDERALASWIGLSEEEATAPAAAQRYLLSIADTSGVYRLSVIPRAALVLASAGTVLCLGLLLIHVRRLRHPGVILAVLSVILLGALFYPEPAIVAGQASVLGLLLILLVIVLRRWLRPTVPSVRAAGGRPSRIIHSSTEFVQSGSASAVATGSTRELPSPVSAQGASTSTKAAVS